MNDQTNQQVAVQPKANIQSGGQIAGIIPQNVNDAYRIAEIIFQTGMQPKELDTPQKITLAVMAGLEVGIAPIVAIQSVAIINNRTVMWGDVVLGLVQGSDVCEYVQEWIEGEGDEMVAFCEAKRKGYPKPTIRKFSADDAKKADLWRTEPTVKKTRRDGSSYTVEAGPWYKYPQRMLQMRARAWALRDTFADVLKGIRVREEEEDHVRNLPSEPKDITPPVRRSYAEGQEPSVEARGLDASSVERQVAEAMGQPVEDIEIVDPETGEVVADDLDQDAEAGQSTGDDPVIEHDHEAGPSIDDELEWLQKRTLMLWSGTHYNNVEIFATQWRLAKEQYPEPEGLSEEIRAKMVKVFNACKKIANGAEEPSAMLPIVANTSGINEKDFVQ